LLLSGARDAPPVPQPAEAAEPALRPKAPPRPQPPHAVRGDSSTRPRAGAGRTETFRIEVGSVHEIGPGNIVGAIANEAGIDGSLIGRVDIRDDHSFVDLPEGMPREIFKALKKTRLAGRELRITRVAGKAQSGATRPAKRSPGRRGIEHR
jgi:ATP-dependent RNA helicase DeaD